LLRPEQERLLGRHREAQPQHARRALRDAGRAEHDCATGRRGGDLDQRLLLRAARGDEREAWLPGKPRRSRAEAAHQHQIELRRHVADARWLTGQAGVVDRGDQQAPTRISRLGPDCERSVAIAPDVRADHVADLGEAMRGQRLLLAWRARRCAALRGCSR
jgi:hypothetical protein